MVVVMWDEQLYFNAEWHIETSNFFPPLSIKITDTTSRICLMSPQSNECTNHFSRSAFCELQELNFQSTTEMKPTTRRPILPASILTCCAVVTARISSQEAEGTEYQRQRGCRSHFRGVSCLYIHTHSIRLHLPLQRVFHVTGGAVCSLTHLQPLVLEWIPKA